MGRAKKTARIVRRTRETAIDVTIEVPGKNVSVKTPIPFLNHMLTLMAAHGGFGLTAKASGDVEVDDHHLVEDMGICLGQAFARALGDKRGIRRYGSALVPMDEALVEAIVDISGRSYLAYGIRLKRGRIKKFDAALVEEFLLAFARSVPLTLHLVQRAGKNLHHVTEAVFKSLGRALGQAVGRDSGSKGIPSTKGLL